MEMGKERRCIPVSDLDKSLGVGNICNQEANKVAQSGRDLDAIAAVAGDGRAGVRDDDLGVAAEVGLLVVCVGDGAGKSSQLGQVGLVGVGGEVGFLDFLRGEVRPPMESAGSDPEHHLKSGGGDIARFVWERRVTWGVD